jgi:Ca2+-binding EF-hand superfamily protein
MSESVGDLSILTKETATNVGLDGKPTNARQRQNMFEDEVVLTEKQIMRKKMNEDRNAMKEMLKFMTPIDIFTLFDDDDSGLIDYGEFRKVLPMLDIHISDAKAYRYFKMCDSDGSNEIDLDEFKVALYLCDPTSGNPVGFKPTKFLTPMDAFEMFDEDASGFLDEDEFYYAFEYLQLTLKDTKHEKIFTKIDHDEQGSIDYLEFRDVFLAICNVRRELEDRGIEVPSFTTRATLESMFRAILLEEEERERMALAEARRYKRWLLEVRDKRKLLTRATWRALAELKTALDLGGHVYVFGGGSRGQFAAPSSSRLQTKNFEFQNFKVIADLWKDRVKPEGVCAINSCTTYYR